MTVFAVLAFCCSRPDRLTASGEVGGDRSRLELRGVRPVAARPRQDPAGAVAGFRFTPDRRQWGQFHLALSRAPRTGTSVMLEVGGQPFLLVARGRDAWSRGSLQDQAIIEAVRGARSMKAQGRDSSGRRFTERFDLAGAPTAIDSAAARCSLRGAGKIR